MLSSGRGKTGWRVPQLGRGVSMPAVLLAAVLLTAAPTVSARADCATCCRMTDCRLGSNAVANLVQLTVKDMITVLGDYIVSQINQFQSDMLPRYANQGSNNFQNVINTMGVVEDKTLATGYASRVARTRAQNAVRMIPSRTACRISTRDDQMTTTLFRTDRSATYDSDQRTSTDYAANAPGTITEKGSLATSRNLVDELGRDFCDPSVVQPPSGFTCTAPATDSQGRSMAFRYTQPWQAVFGVEDGMIPPDPANPENRAARLFVRMAIEPVPIDPLRGAPLTRTDGQTTFLNRQRDIAAMNLAHSALDRMVDDRLGTNTTGSESIEYTRRQLWDNADLTKEDVAQRPAQPVGANYDDLAPLVGEVNKIYWQIFNNLERLAAIKAVHLARVIQEQGAGNSGVAVRTIRSN